MSRKQIAESLGLFTLAPSIKKVQKKDREAQQLATQLMNQNKDFFDGPQVEDTQDLATTQQRKRDLHLQSVDQTKKLFIYQILRRNCMYDENDVYEEIVEAHLRGDTMDDSNA